MGFTFLLVFLWLRKSFSCSSGEHKLARTSDSGHHYQQNTENTSDNGKCEGVTDSKLQYFHTATVFQIQDLNLRLTRKPVKATILFDWLFPFGNAYLLVRCFCILGRNRNLRISSCSFSSTTRPQSTLILKCETPQKILSCTGYTGTYLSRRQPQRQIGLLHLDLQLKAEDMNSLSKPLALFWTVCHSEMTAKCPLSTKPRY